MKINALLEHDPLELQYTTPLYETLMEENAIAIHEALTLQHDKKNDVIAVVSDEEDAKKASSETYRSKAALKKAGFKWSGGNWIIDADKFDQARDVISQLNKTDYLITKLEDAQEYIGDATSDPKKGKLTGMIQTYIEELASATDEAAASAEIKNYLNFFAGFHQYSFYNRILIYIQNPKATKVASFKAWKQKGRQVQKGSRGMQILVPIFPKGQNPKYNKDKDGKEIDAAPVKFIVGSVFDIADTKAINEKGEVPDEPEWWGNNDPSETADELHALVENAAKADGINVTYEAAKGGEKGFSAGGHINITSDVEGAGRVSTMVHEYAHELMHRKDGKFYVGDHINRNTEVKELQAESVSYIVLKHYDIPVEHHTKYLALWKATGVRVHQNMESISKTAHYIIKQIDKQESKSDNPT